MLRLNRHGIYSLSFCTQLIERRDTKPKHRHSRRHKFVSRVDTIYFKQQRAQCVQMNATIANHNSACEHNNQWVFGCRAKLAKSETKHRMEAHRAIPSTPLPSRWRKQADKVAYANSLTQWAASDFGHHGSRSDNLNRSRALRPQSPLCERTTRVDVQRNALNYLLHPTERLLYFGSFNYACI